MASVITTRYLSANKRGGVRIVANSGISRLIHKWDSRKRPAENHLAAAQVLKEKLGIGGEMIGAASGETYVFVAGPEVKVVATEVANTQ